MRDHFVEGVGQELTAVNSGSPDVQSFFVGITSKVFTVRDLPPLQLCEIRI